MVQRRAFSGMSEQTALSCWALVICVWVGKRVVPICQLLVRAGHCWHPSHLGCLASEPQSLSLRVGCVWISVSSEGHSDLRVFLALWRKKGPWRHPPHLSACSQPQFTFSDRAVQISGLLLRYLFNPSSPSGARGGRSVRRHSSVSAL